MNNQMDWDFFFRQLTAGMNIDETCFFSVMTPMRKNIISATYHSTTSRTG